MKTLNNFLWTAVRIFSIALVLVACSRERLCRAQTAPTMVEFPMGQITGAANTVTLTVTPDPTQNPQTDGVGLYGGFAIRFVATNGISTNALMPGNYWLSAPGWASQLHFCVPKTNAVVNVVNLIGPPTYAPFPFAYGYLWQWAQFPTNVIGTGGGGGSVSGGAGISVSGSTVALAYPNSATTNTPATVTNLFVMRQYYNSQEGGYLWGDGNNDLFLGWAGSPGAFSTSGQIGIGAGALGGALTTDANVGIGENALGVLTDGGYNVAIAGVDPMYRLANGQYNTAIGMAGNGTFNASGDQYTGSESYNIDIGNEGIAGESQQIHIGTAGVHTNTTIAGVLHADGGGVSNVDAVAMGGVPESNWASNAEPGLLLGPPVNSFNGEAIVGNGMQFTNAFDHLLANASVGWDDETNFTIADGFEEIELSQNGHNGSIGHTITLTASGGIVLNGPTTANGVFSGDAGGLSNNLPLSACSPLSLMNSNNVAQIADNAIFGIGSGLTGLPSQWAYNLLDYGFIPNNSGDGAVNDLAWTNLYNLSTNWGGMNAYFPGYGSGGGTFYFNHPLNIPLNAWGGSPRTSVRIFGDGSPVAPLSILQINPPNGSLGDIISTNQGGLEMDHLSIVGGNANVPNVFDSATEPNFHELLVNDNGGTNFVFGNTANVFAGYGGQVIDNIQGNLTHDACFVWAGAQVNSLLFQHNFMKGGAGYTYFLFSGPYDNDNALIDNICEMGNNTTGYMTNAFVITNQSDFNTVKSFDLDDAGAGTQEGGIVGGDCSFNHFENDRLPGASSTYPTVLDLSGGANTILESETNVIGPAGVRGSFYGYHYGAFAGNGAAVTNVSGTNIVVRSPLMPAQAQAMQLWPGVTARTVLETNASFTVADFVPMGSLSSAQLDIPNTNLTALTVTISAPFTPYPVATNSLVIPSGQTGFIYADYDGVSTNMGAGL